MKKTRHWLCAHCVPMFNFVGGEVLFRLLNAGVPVVPSFVEHFNLSNWHRGGGSNFLFAV